MCAMQGRAAKQVHQVCTQRSRCPQVIVNDVYASPISFRRSALQAAGAAATDGQDVEHGTRHSGDVQFAPHYETSAARALRDGLRSHSVQMVTMLHARSRAVANAELQLVRRSATALL